MIWLEGLALLFAVVALVVAWIEIRFLGSMLMISKHHAATITKILDDLCAKLIRKRT